MKKIFSACVVAYILTGCIPPEVATPTPTPVAPLTDPLNVESYTADNSSPESIEGTWMLIITDGFSQSTTTDSGSGLTDSTTTEFNSRETCEIVAGNPSEYDMCFQELLTLSGNNVTSGDGSLSLTVYENNTKMTGNLSRFQSDNSDPLFSTTSTAVGTYNLVKIGPIGMTYGRMFTDAVPAPTLGNVHQFYDVEKDVTNVDDNVVFETYTAQWFTFVDTDINMYVNLSFRQGSPDLVISNSVSHSVLAPFNPIIDIVENKAHTLSIDYSGVSVPSSDPFDGYIDIDF